MFEKVNPEHPDKVADRIAGAIVDLAYQREENPKVAVEVLIGHGYCYIIIESSIEFDYDDIDPIVQRITKEAVMTVRLLSIPQDKHLADNQQGAIKCGDNGIFRGKPITYEQRLLTTIADSIYDKYPHDGKYIIAGYHANNGYQQGDPRRDGIIPNDELDRSIAVTICQSNAKYDDILTTWHDTFEGIGGIKRGEHVEKYKGKYYSPIINPLGEWTGGPNVDSGATNRKLGSDMGDAVTGGGLMGKDLSKADVSVNIVCHLMAMTSQCDVEACCSIGDERVKFNIGGRIEEFPYDSIVRKAREYITHLGGFEKFAEWGLIAPKAW